MGVQSHFGSRTVGYVKQPTLILSSWAASLSQKRRKMSAYARAALTSRLLKMQRKQILHMVRVGHVLGIAVNVG